MVKTTWKCYIPGSGERLVQPLIGASSINARRNVVVTAYTISETALKEYKVKLSKLWLKRKSRLWDAVAREKLENAHVTERKFVPTGRGEHPALIH